MDCLRQTEKLSRPEREKVEEVIAGTLGSMYTGRRYFERGEYLVYVLFVAGTDTVRRQTNTRQYTDSFVLPFIDCGGHPIPSYSSVT